MFVIVTRIFTGVLNNLPYFQSCLSQIQSLRHKMQNTCYNLIIFNVIYFLSEDFVMNNYLLKFSNLCKVYIYRSGLCVICYSAIYVQRVLYFILENNIFRCFPKNNKHTNGLFLQFFIDINLLVLLTSSI